MSANVANCKANIPACSKQKKQHQSIQLKAHGNSLDDTDVALEHGLASTRLRLAMQKASMIPFCAWPCPIAPYAAPAAINATSTLIEYAISATITLIEHAVQWICHLRCKVLLYGM